jgi:hypothetical protein
MTDAPDFIGMIDVTVEAAAVEDAQTQIRRLSELQNYGSDDPNCLLGNRYLSRQGGLLFVAPTGTGKSTAIIQMALLWAMGKPAFGIYPRCKIKTLIIQAENDDGDLAEMRDGVLHGMTASGLLTDDQAHAAADAVHVVRDVVSTGDEVGPAMDSYVKASGCDLVVLDPIFSYMGGETNSAKDVGHFLRNVVNPVLLGRNVAFIAVHHSNKPLAGQQKQEWQAGDFAYLGAGSAEFANWARAVLAIRSMGSHDVFQLVAGKRGKRIGWEDEEDGSPITSRYIKHGSEGLCWLDATQADIEAAKSESRPAKATEPEPDIQAAVEITRRQIWKYETLKQTIKEELEIKGRNRLDEFMKRLCENERVGRGRYYESRLPHNIIGDRKDVENYLENKGAK